MTLEAVYASQHRNSAHRRTSAGKRISGVVAEGRAEEFEQDSRVVAEGGAEGLGHGDSKAQACCGRGTGQAADPMGQPRMGWNIDGDQASGAVNVLEEQEMAALTALFFLGQDLLIRSLEFLPTYPSTKKIAFPQLVLEYCANPDDQTVQPLRAVCSASGPMCATRITSNGVSR